MYVVRKRTSIEFLQASFFCDEETLQAPANVQLWRPAIRACWAGGLCSDPQALRPPPAHLTRVPFALQRLRFLTTPWRDQQMAMNGGLSVGHDEAASSPEEVRLRLMTCETPAAEPEDV